MRAREAGAVDGAIVAGGAALLALALLWNPVRTYLKPPDLVFLLPLEGEARHYFRGAWVYGAAVSGAAAAFVFGLYLPFHRLTDAAPAPVLALVLMILKMLLYFGAWKERQFRSRAARALLTAVKTLAVFATVYALLRFRLSYGHLLLPLLWGAYAAAVKIPESYRIHWQHLLQLERRTQARIDAWFRFFTDLPQQAGTYRRRAYLDAILKPIRHTRRNAALYLYARTLLRSPEAAMIGRMIVLAAALIWLFPGPWSAAPIYIVFIWLIGMQLRGLPPPAGNPLLDAVSPIADAERRNARRKVRRMAVVAAAVILSVPLFILLEPGVAVACAGAGCLFSLLTAGR